MKRFLSFLVSINLLLVSFGIVNVDANNGVSYMYYGFTRNKAHICVEKFDVIQSGNYYQSDFKRKDGIRWMVLDVKGDDIYCVSEKNLYPLENVANRSFEDIETEINSKFYNEAFTTAEQKDIKETEKNKSILVPYDYDIEITNYSDYTLDVNTNYCREGASVVNYYNSKKVYCYDYATHRIKEASSCGVRPAIHIRKTSKLYKKVGTVGSHTNFLNPSKTKITKIKAKKKKIKIVWKKKGKYNGLYDGVMGYKLQYSTSKKFKKAKTITIKKAKKNTRTISKLKAKKRYYFRIRTYSIIHRQYAYGPDGNQIITYTSKWSKVKSKKTK